MRRFILGEALGPAEPLVIHGNFTYTNCERSEKACEVTEVSEDSLIEVLRLGHETADVTGEGEVNVHCGFFINCTYNGENLEGTGKGPLLATAENGEVTITKQEPTEVSGLCPEVVELDIELHPLEAVYLSE